eukprot:RCo038683
MDLENVNVLEGELGLLQDLRDGNRRGKQQLGERVNGRVVPGLHLDVCGPALLLGVLVAGHEHGAASVREPGGVGGGDRTLVLGRAERRLQLGVLLQVGLLNEVVHRDDLPRPVVDGHDLLLEVSLLHRLQGLLVALRGELVLGGAGDAVELRHHVAVVAHGLAGGLLRDSWEPWDPPRGRTGVIPELLELPLGVLGPAEGHHGEPPGQPSGKRNLGVGHGVRPPRNHHVGMSSLDDHICVADALQRGGAGERDHVRHNVPRKVQLNDNLTANVGGCGGQHDIAPNNLLHLHGVNLSLVDQPGDCSRAQTNAVHVQQVAIALAKRRPLPCNDDRPPKQVAALVHCGKQRNGRKNDYT